MLLITDCLLPAEPVLEHPFTGQGGLFASWRNQYISYFFGLVVELVDVVTLQRVFEPTRHEADSAPFVAWQQNSTALKRSR